MHNNRKLSIIEDDLYIYIFLNFLFDLIVDVNLIIKLKLTQVGSSLIMEKALLIACSDIEFLRL